MRAVAPVTAAVLCTAALAATASAATLPPEGVFENCSLDTQMSTCVQRLEAMSSGGMRVVVVAPSGSLASLAVYAIAADALGMNVMWELSNPGWWQEPLTATTMAGTYPYVAMLCGCHQNGAILDAFVRYLGALPGTYGYYAADDTMIGAGDRDGIAAYVAQIKQVDPNHKVLIGVADPTQAQQYLPIADALGTEIYPVMNGTLTPVRRHRAAWTSVDQTAHEAQRAANLAGKASAFILQAFTWGDNLDDGQATGVCSPRESKWACYARLRYPSPADQLALRNQVLEHAHPQLILWWSFPGTYGQAGDDTYSIYPTGAAAAARWSGLSAAVRAPYPVAVVRDRRDRSHRRHSAFRSPAAACRSAPCATAA